MLLKLNAVGCYGESAAVKYNLNCQSK